MYKLFSKVWCDRIKGVLITEQSCDQAGFRPGFSCDDHLFAITLLAEKCNEFNLPLWVATLDFKKAFDSIDHGSIWEALSSQGVQANYVHTLHRLYKGQRACVKVDCNSRDFGIERGTKQGDPISPLLFNTVIEHMMRKVKTKWAAKQYGMEVGNGRSSLLTNLRFPDDILLVARSLPQIRQMIADISVEGKRIGLQLHPEKTKILHNGIGYGAGVQSATADGMNIEVLGSGSDTMYLGRALSLTNPHDTELKHRIRKAWAKFGLYKNDLTDKSIPLKLRMKLFNAVLTPTALYGCCSWVMTEERAALLRAVQMKMMRSIVAQRRRPEETWVEWVQRATHVAKDVMAEHSVPNWDDLQHQRVLLWKDRIDTLAGSRWTTSVLDWQPIGRRSRGHPRTRWIDMHTKLTLSLRGT